MILNITKAKNIFYIYFKSNVNKNNIKFYLTKKLIISNIIPITKPKIEKL